MADSRDAGRQAPPQVAELVPGSAVITAQGVSKVFYGDKGHAVDALQDVSIQVSESEGVGIVGESGSGKTTLARVLVGLEQQSSGKLTIDGVDIHDWRAASKDQLRTVRNAVQMVFQDPYSSLNPMRTVGWALSEAVRLRSARSTDVTAEVERLLQTVGLPSNAAGRRPAALSGGMRQRVAIARALAGNPRILICDESVSALDVSVQAQILNLLSRLRDERGIGYLFITHDLAVVRQVTERIYVMHRGRVVESGRTDDVVGDPQDPYTQQLLAAAPRSGPRWLAAHVVGPDA